MHGLDYLKLFFIVMTSFLISCETNEDDTIVYESVPTIVKGNMSDIQRNINIPNLEMKLVRSSVVVTLGGSGLDIQEVETIATDEFGNYEIEFDYVKDGKDYGLQQVYYGFPYHTEFIGEYTPLVPGEINIRNVDAWRPVKIKLELQVLNNNNPPLLVDNKIVESGYNSFPQESIFGNGMNKTIYLDSKPNSAVELNFHYTTGYTNADYHSKREIVQTTLQDTISFTYLIDCASF